MSQKLNKTINWRRRRDTGIKTSVSVITQGNTKRGMRATNSGWRETGKKEGGVDNKGCV